MPTVAQFHDFFRRAILTNPTKGGKCVVTRAVNALPPDTQASIIEQVRTFSNFNEGNDPWGEHDFGAFEVAGVGKVNWKIDDYEDETMQYGAENKLKGYPVLTIMLAEDY